MTTSIKTYKLRAPQTCKACGRRIDKGQTADVYADAYGFRHYSHPAPCPVVKLAKSEPEINFSEAMENYARVMKESGT